MKKILWIMMVGILSATPSASAAYSQDIAGDWQGTLKKTPPVMDMDLRLVLHITKSGNGDWSAILYSIDQRPEGLDGVAVTSITLQGGDFKFSCDAVQASYEGRLSSDVNSITGTWRGRRVLPLELQRTTKVTAWPFEAPQHKVSFVTVEKDVKLEVLDFGGSGRPMILLAGLGATAHTFDRFAPKFTATYHVYGITRRGFGASSAPVPANGNYSADRLGDDVLAVMETLKLNRPVLVGHSFGGEELSSVGSRHPEKVAGLVYLDAGYWYAFYDPKRGDIIIDAIELRKKLEDLLLANVGGGPSDPGKLAEELIQTGLPQMVKDLRAYQERLQATRGPTRGRPPAEIPAIGQAIVNGQQKYTEIPVPILAFFAAPSNLGGEMFKDDPAARARFEDWDAANKEAVARAFETGLPTARVVRLPHAEHWVMASHEADVLREMNAFLRGLP